MTTTLEGGEGSASRPGRSLPPEKTRYPLYRRLGGPQSRSGQVRKFSPPAGLGSRTVQPVASRYTDWATRTTNICREEDVFICVTVCGGVLTSYLHVTPSWNEWSYIVTPPIFLYDTGRDLTYIYIHTYINIYICIYICVCVCVCVYKSAYLLQKQSGYLILYLHIHVFLPHNNLWNLELFLYRPWHLRPVSVDSIPSVVPTCKRCVNVTFDWQ